MKCWILLVAASSLFLCLHRKRLAIACSRRINPTIAKNFWRCPIPRKRLWMRRAAARWRRNRFLAEKPRQQDWTWISLWRVLV